MSEDVFDKAGFIHDVRDSRSRWDELIGQVSDDLMLQPGVEGDWSAKDVLAHVMWYERQMVEMLESRALVGSDLWALPLDERNAGVHAEIEDMSLEHVRAESASVFAELVTLLKALPIAAYEDSAHFRQMPPEWKPWDVIAGNTFRHYAEHTESIQRLLGIEPSSAR